MSNKEKFYDYPIAHSIPQYIFICGGHLSSMRMAL